jgi:hypothetical protein
LADVELAALKQLTGMVVRQAEVMTMNTLFHTLAMIFLCSLLLMPWGEQSVCRCRRRCARALITRLFSLAQQLDLGFL